MSLSRKVAVGLASLAFTLGVSAGPAFAAHAGQYHATSQGNGKCHDTGPRGSTSPDASSKGQGVAAMNSDTISPFACP